MDRRADEGHLGFWSHVALVDRATARDWTLQEISLEPRAGFGSVPLQNGIQLGTLRAYDDSSRFPNVAHIRFTTAPEALEAGDTLDSVLRRAVADLQKQRSTLDLPALLLEWLGYVWGVADRTNPLERQQGVPSAVFVESVFGIAGIELTPGCRRAVVVPRSDLAGGEVVARVLRLGGDDDADRTSCHAVAAGAVSASRGDADACSWRIDDGSAGVSGCTIALQG